MRVNTSERDMRASLFTKIEDCLLPRAEARVGAIKPFDVEGIVFGSKPTPRAYGRAGELRFELGRWDADRFIPFGARLLQPLQPPKFDVPYPKETFYLWRNTFVHYTPITRRLDYFEVWDYFSAKRAVETDVREKALGLLASKTAKKHSAEDVKVTCRYIRYAEQYVVVTGVESRAFENAGSREYQELLELLR